MIKDLGKSSKKTQNTISQNSVLKTPLSLKLLIYLFI